MNVRDPEFTELLEDALNMVAQQPSRMLHYIEDRYNLETGQLQAWLNEFNGGARALKLERIYAVKRELGVGGKPKPAAAAPAAKVAIAPVEPMILPRPPAPAPAPVSPPVPAKPAAPVTPPAPKPAAAVLPATGHPWETVALSLRNKVFHGWRPVLESIANGSVTSKACRDHDCTPEGLALFCHRWLGMRSGHSPEMLRAFIAWGDAKCKPAEAPVKLAKTPVADKSAVSEPRAPSPERPSDRTVATLRTINRHLDELLTSLRPVRSSASKSSYGSCRRKLTR
ncbi:MAG: hypothetical protein V4773_27645 [Verrucomicrobiota bacterium]